MVYLRRREQKRREQKRKEAKTSEKKATQERIQFGKAFIYIYI